MLSSRSHYISSFTLFPASITYLPLVPPFKQEDFQVPVLPQLALSPFGCLPGSLTPGRPALPFTGRRGYRGERLPVACCFVMLRPFLRGPPGISSRRGRQGDTAAKSEGRPSWATSASHAVSLPLSLGPASMLPVNGMVRPLPQLRSVTSSSTSNVCWPQSAS